MDICLDLRLLIGFISQLFKIISNSIYPDLAQREKGENAIS